MVIEEVYAEPCPFCARRDIRTIRSATRMWTTVCWPEDSGGCGARTDWQFTSQAALIRWNRRDHRQ